MKLLLQNNPVYIKDCKPPQRIGGGIPYPRQDEITIANVSVKIKRSVTPKFIEGLILDDIQKGINKEWKRVTIFGTGGEEHKLNIETFIANQSDESK